MAATWFAIVCLMFTTFVVLDGFDFGAGILHLLLAKNDTERQSIISAIGPLWDANEVWLVAGGGVLFFAFPRAYSAGFSGFYLPLTMVLWLLILRGISIEFRSMEEAPLWHSLWDGVFCLSSALMAIVLGAALGNIIRGVPLEKNGYFTGPLFTNLLLSPHPGVLDWYTTLVGIFAFFALALHGALFLRMKLSGEIRDRAEKLAKSLWWVVAGMSLVTSGLSNYVQPRLFQALESRSWTWPICATTIISLIAIPIMLRKPGEVRPFIASCAFLFSTLAMTAAAMYPWLLASTVNPAFDIDVHNALAGELGLHAGLGWWVLAIALAIGYFAFLFRAFRGKVRLDDGYGH